jgi:2-phosphosulfolactate phosphatase
MAFLEQGGEVRFEWGPSGLNHLLPQSDAIIIVDVLSFSTCVDVAVGNGAVVYPFRWDGEDPASFARHHQAILASKPGQGGRYSLSPSSLLTLPRGARLVLPSPNGSTLSASTGETPTLTGCLRNARAIAEYARQFGTRISVIAAGERWPDGSLRPAIEDLLGAGAILSELDGKHSAETRVAVAAYLACLPHLKETILESVSGQELIARGRRVDVDLACELNQSDSRPVLAGGAYRHPPD